MARLVSRQFAMRVAGLLVTSALVGAGCQSETDDTQEQAKVEQPADTAQPELTPEQKAIQEVEALAEVIETPDDYIFIAESEISEENLEEQLAKLEAEIEAEQPTEPEEQAQEAP